MTQIIVTLDKNADEKSLLKVIDDLKGVIKTSLKYKKEKSKAIETSEKKSPWLEKLHSIKDSIDPSIIDISDPRTNYIMSK